jgi:hypothetical protein
MAGINHSLETPSEWLHLAPTQASATNLALADADELAFRVVHVGKIVGPVTLIDHASTEHTFTLNYLQNENGRILGQWTAIKGGSTSYDFHCGR